MQRYEIFVIVMALKGFFREIVGVVLRCPYARAYK